MKSAFCEPTTVVKTGCAGVFGKWVKHVAGEFVVEMLSVGPTGVDPVDSVWNHVNPLMVQLIVWRPLNA